MNKRKRKLAALLGTACMGLSIVLCPMAALPVQAAPSTTSIMPYSDAISWVYKIEYGKVYKRLFNFSTSNWIGDWILVRVLE